MPFPLTTGTSARVISFRTDLSRFWSPQEKGEDRMKNAARFGGSVAFIGTGVVVGLIAGIIVGALLGMGIAVLLHIL